MFFSLQLPSPNQQGYAWCSHFPHLLLSVCLCDSYRFPFPPSPRPPIRRTWSETPTHWAQSLNCLYPLGILKVQMTLQNDSLQIQKQHHGLPHPDPTPQHVWFFHCCSNLNFSVYQSKEMHFLISILQTPSGIPQTSCGLLPLSHAGIRKSLHRSRDQVRPSDPEPGVSMTASTQDKWTGKME